ncbi:MAG: hypothetical protein K0U84_14015 [Actinomycetia bacterium]|nr:hypothetical protein [Actinomycetes bacterium]
MINRLITFAEGKLRGFYSVGAYASRTTEEDVPVDDDPTQVLLDIDCRGKPRISCYAQNTDNANAVEFYLDFQVAGGIWWPVLTWNNPGGGAYTNQHLERVAHRVRLRAATGQGDTATVNAVLAASH